MSENNFIIVSKEILGQKKSFRFRAQGWSMNPSVKDGDYLTVYPFNQDALSVGDIVYYLVDNRPVVHRIIRFFSQNGIKTAMIQGDSCYGQPDTIPVKDILGKVLLIERQGHMKRLDTTWHKILGHTIAAFSPCVSWAMPLLLRGKKMLLGSR